MHLAWRWFTGLSFDQEIPHHSTLQEPTRAVSRVAAVRAAVRTNRTPVCGSRIGAGPQLSVDGSFVEANAAKESRIPREQLAAAGEVHHTVRQYLKELQEQNPVEEPVHEQEYRPRIPILRMPPRVAHQHGWGTRTTIWWTMIVA